MTCIRSKLSFVVLWVGISAAGSVAAGGGPQLETDSAVLSFGDATTGFACAELREKTTDVSFLRLQAATSGLWRLAFRAGCTGAETVLDSRRAKPGAMARTTDGLRFTWKDLDLAGESNAVDVVCDVTREQDAFAFRIRVANRSRVCGLARTDYPLLGGVMPSGTGESLMPHWGNWGQRLMRDRTEEVLQDYPSFCIPMPFAAFLQGGAGMYIGCHDGGAAPKTFHVTPSNDVAFEIPAENAGVPGAAGAPAYATVVAAFRGDWWRAAARYRAWALKQTWTAKGPIATRADYPKRLRENGFWMNLWGGPEEVESSVDYMLERTSNAVPFGVHWYVWHQIPFDNSYPEYFPAKKGFAEAVKRMTSKGVLVMPYLNGRLWDRDIPSFAAAKPFAAKKPDGEPYYEDYNSGRLFAVMCPAVPHWGNRLLDICTRLVDDCGVNAIYFDQIGAAAPKRCHDPRHGHPLGGGSHWAAGYRASFAPIRARIPGVVLATENTAEPYMDTLDAYLTWTIDRRDDVPALPAVYGGYTTWFCSPSDQADTPAAFRAYVLRDTLWGAQPGWMGPWIYDDAHREQFETLMTCARLRLRYRAFLAEGRIVGEVADDLPNPTFTVTWHNQVVREVTLKSVTALIWEDLQGRRATFVANLSDARQSFAGTAAEGVRIACELAPGEVRVFGTAPHGK